MSNYTCLIKTYSCRYKSCLNIDKYISLNVQYLYMIYFISCTHVYKGVHSGRHHFCSVASTSIQRHPLPFRGIHFRSDAALLFEGIHLNQLLCKIFESTSRIKATCMNIYCALKILNSI